MTIRESVTVEKAPEGTAVKVRIHFSTDQDDNGSWKDLYILQTGGVLVESGDSIVIVVEGCEEKKRGILLPLLTHTGDDQPA